MVHSPSPGAYGSLSGVTAISAGNAWAVGTAADKALILHWNGTAWRQAGSPSVTGAGIPGNNSLLILHWNGAAWKRVSSNLPPRLGNLRGVAATSARNAWAVGCSGCLAEGAGAPLIEQWNGAKWTKVSAPSQEALAGLNGVTATSPTNAWAVGTPAGSPGHTTGIARWNGHTWKPGAEPEPRGTGARRRGGCHLRPQCLGSRRDRGHYPLQGPDLALERQHLEVTVRLGSIASKSRAGMTAPRPGLGRVLSIM